MGCGRRGARHTSTMSTTCDNIVAALILASGLMVSLLTIGDGKAESRRVDVPVSEHQRDAEDGLGEEIQHAVEDGLGVRGDDVGALRHAPRDRVAQPHEQRQHSAQHVRAVHVAAEPARTLATYAGEGPEDVEHRGGAEGPPAWGGRGS